MQNHQTQSCAPYIQNDIQNNILDQKSLDKIFIHSRISCKEIIDACDDLFVRATYPKLYAECVMIRDAQLHLFENYEHFNQYAKYCRIIPQIRNFIYFYFNTETIHEITTSYVEYANVPDVFLDFIKNNLELFKEIVIYEFNSSTNNKFYDKLHFQINIFPLNDCAMDYNMMDDPIAIRVGTSPDHKCVNRYRLMITVKRNNCDKKRKGDIVVEPDYVSYKRSKN